MIIKIAIYILNNITAKIDHIVGAICGIKVKF